MHSTMAAPLAPGGYGAYNLHMKPTPIEKNRSSLPREEPVPGSNGTLVILRETPSERACSILEDGYRMWPSRVVKISFTADHTAPVMGADERL
jgi:hypothetical protein